ncbi:DUF2066 domain-containing protein [Neptuniibacter sp. QD29_5]|uniref:DUF2066 domain-containing protein n=1 Tax=Neptuniibacter sp. QD29_5 TaxID=3398207 RepID=UPI0039F63ED5
MDLMRSLIAVLLLTVSQFVIASTVTDLYRVTLPIEERRLAPSDLQVSSGLVKVLVKVSGNSSIADDYQIQSQLKAPARTLKQFSYITTEDGGYLVLDFHPEVIDSLVTRTGFKPLGEQRATVLLWFASNASGEQDYLKSNDSFYKALQFSAKSRGLPLQFPILDLTDQIALSPTDLWILKDQQISQASTRYKPDAVIAGRLTKSESEGVSVAGLFINDGINQPLAESGNIDQVANAVINRVADTLFKPIVSYKLSHFQTGVAVQVENISNLSDYVQLIDFLKRLSVVRQVKIERAIGNQITVRLNLDGSEEQLRQAISLEPQLQMLDSLRNQDGSAVMVYRWQG